MKHIATVSGKHLVNGVSRACKAKKPNAVLPILDCIIVQTIPDGLMLSASNLDVSIVTAVKATVIQPKITFSLIPQAVNLLKGLREDDNIEIWIGENFQMEIVSAAGKSKFTFDDPATFPLIPTFEHSIEWKDNSVFEAICMMQKALNFVSKDDLRPIMTGVFLTNNNVVATDSFRLYVKDCSLGENAFNVVIPRDGVAALDALNGKQAIRLRTDNQQYISFNDPTTKIVIKLIEGQFPHYESILPKDNPITVKLNKANLIYNIDLALSIAPVSTKKVGFTFTKDKYTVFAIDPDFGLETTLTAVCEYKGGTDEEFSIAFQGAFLKSIVECCENEDILLEMSGQNRAAIVKEEGALFLAMPVILKK